MITRQHFFLFLFLVCSLSTAADAFAAECNDGIDNDGDGLVDWQADLGCTDAADVSEGPVSSGTIKNGWTVFEPVKDLLNQPGSGTRIFYVSDSTGSDSNNGSSADSPFKTIAKGIAALRTGYPDWLLLRRGDTFTDQSLGRWTKSGRSLTEPIVVASYGSSTERPVLKLGVTDGVNPRTGISISGAAAVHFLAVIGLRFYADSRDPDSPTYSAAEQTSGSGQGIQREFEEAAEQLFMRLSKLFHVAVALATSNR